MVWLLRLELHCIFSGIWLSAARSSYFIPPDAIRPSRQGGGPTNSALVLEKEVKENGLFQEGNGKERERWQKLEHARVSQIRVEIHEGHRTRNLEDVRVQRPGLAFD